MTLSLALLPEFNHEAGITRTFLERVPEPALDWKPHERSGTLGWLTTHLVTIPLWAVDTLTKDSHDVMPDGNPAEPPAQATSRRELLQRFDLAIDQARTAIAQASDHELTKPWSLLRDGVVMLTMPRIAVLRSFVMNHSIHHRAQLGVYLRLNDIPVPQSYGPTADERELVMKKAQQSKRS